MTGIVTLTQPSVNSGSAVTLNGVAVTYLWINLVRATPIPGSFNVSEVDTAGFENPIIRLSGVINIADDTTTDRYLKQFSKIQFDGGTTGNNGAIKLTLGAGGEGGGGNNTHYLQDTGSSNDFIYVIIKSFNIKFDTAIKEGSKWMYDIEFVETLTS